MNLDEHKEYRCKVCAHWPDEHKDGKCHGCVAGRHENFEHEYVMDPDDWEIDFPPGVHVLDDGVYIYDEHGEIVMWHRDEWVQDPSVALVVARAIQEYYEHGPYVMRRRLGKNTGPYDALRWKAGERDYTTEPPPEAVDDTQAVEMAVRGFFAEQQEVLKVEWEQYPSHHDDWLILKVYRYDGYLFVLTDGSYEVFDEDDVVVLETDVVNEELPDELHEDVRAYAEFGEMLYNSMSVLRGVYSAPADIKVERDGPIRHNEYNRIVG